MSYQQEVKAAARDLITGDEANWDLARRTCENTYGGRGDTESQSKERVSMERWAADVRNESNRRFSPRTAKDYKQMWRSFGGQHTAHRLSWAEAWEEMHYPKGKPTDRQPDEELSISEKWDKWGLKLSSHLIKGANLMDEPGRLNARAKMWRKIYDDIHSTRLERELNSLGTGEDEWEVAS